MADTLVLRATLRRLQELMHLLKGSSAPIVDDQILDEVAHAVDQINALVPQLVPRFDRSTNRYWYRSQVMRRVSLDAKSLEAYLEEEDRGAKKARVSADPSQEAAVPQDDRLRGADVWRLVHPEIKRVAAALYLDGHYADAVLAAMREINTRVKLRVKAKTGTELDGADLMRQAFSLKKPIIQLDDLSTESGRDIQQGYMEIAAGAMTGIRNPKAHANIMISRARALHFLVLASLLMSKLDDAGC